MERKLDTTSARRFFNGLLRAGKTKRRQNPDDWPSRVELGRSKTELRTARVSVVVVVETLAGSQHGDGTNVRRGVIKVLVADGMAETVD